MASLWHPWVQIGEAGRCPDHCDQSEALPFVVALPSIAKIFNTQEISGESMQLGLANWDNFYGPDVRAEGNRNPHGKSTLINQNNLQFHCYISLPGVQSDVQK